MTRSMIWRAIQLASLIKKFKDDDDAEEKAMDALNKLMAKELMNYVAKNPRSMVDLVNVLDKSGVVRKNG
jgi:hypothetical protein